MPNSKGLMQVGLQLFSYCTVAALLGGAGCGATTQRVRMDSMNRVIGNLSGFEGDPLEKEPVEYMQTGKGNYDQFFSSAAEMHAGIVVSTALSDSLTTNLKKYARSYAASKAADENVKAIVGDTKPEDLTEDQSFALLNLKKKQGELSDDEKKFATRSVANTAQTTLYLGKTGDQAATLISTGSALSQSVRTDFTGMDAVKVPAVTKGLSGSLDNVKEASVKAPPLAKTLSRLGEGLKNLL